MCVCASACSGTKRQDAASFFFFYLLSRCESSVFFFFFNKSYLAANVLGRSLTLLISVWDRELTD